MSEQSMERTPGFTQTSAFLTRTAALLGEQTLARLRAAHILVVGVGAVGGACAEALARSGVGRLTLVDGDTFEASNLNRQPFSAQSVLGHSKTEATQARLADIAPTCQVAGHHLFLKPADIAPLLDDVKADIVVDAIDDLTAKVALLEACVQRNLPVWSAMGAARKLDPLAFRITDISKTQVCPLARNVRQQLRRKGITHGIRCVWSAEPALPLPEGILGSYMPVTATAGLILAADIIAKIKEKECCGR
jgi:tRNA A37 threonylcarbamoyladenosine dehydratase